MRRTRRSLAAVLLVVPLLLALPGQPSVAAAKCAPQKHPGGEWRSFGHDLSNTRRQPREKTISRSNVSTLQPAFVFSAESGGGSGDFTGTPIIADGCLFMGSNDGWVFAANADTGAPVWATELETGGGINSSVAVSGGRVYASVSRTSRPYVVALDQATGKLLWETQIDEQVGSDVYGSPIVYDGVLFIGVSGGSAELGDEADRYAFQGNFVLIETRKGERKPPGTILKKTWTVRPPDPDPSKPKNDFAGATVWATPAIDPRTDAAYVGTGNPFRPQAEHHHANAVLKVDLDRGSRTFGKIVDSGKGEVEEYVPELRQIPCNDIPGNPAPYYPQGIGECGDLDLDFGASANLFRDDDGRLLVGAGQKSGVYHVFDTRNMERVYKTIVGPPSAVGGIVGSTAIDGDAVYGPITIGGYLWSIEREGGAPRWAMPVADGAHWGNPVSTANGVIYTMDLRGFLDAYDAQTGAPLLHTPLAAASNGDPIASWGGVAIARNTVYAAAGITGLPNGYVVGYRPAEGVPEVPLPDDLPAPGGGGGDGDAGLHIVSGPQAQFYGYLTPAVVASKGATIEYTNVDLVRHDVVQDTRTDGVSGPGNQPWCDSYPAGKCPVFWTPLLGVGGSSQVKGLENLEPGTTYSFYCTLHPGMRGTLVAAG